MKRLVFASLVAGALLIVVAATAAVTHDNNGKSGKASLDSFQEAPLTLATTGRGSFRIRVRSDGLHYKLSYSGVESNVTQAHIHLGRTGLAGGIIAFLCGPQPSGRRQARLSAARRHRRGRHRRGRRHRPRRARASRPGT